MTIKTLKCGTKYNKPTLWKETDLKGEWQIGIKIDGIRAFKTEAGWVSRASKPLYNMDHLEAPIGANYEVFRNNWEDTVSLVRTQLEDTGVTQNDLYRLDELDPRLIICTLTDPTVQQLKGLLADQRAAGMEGLIIRQGSKHLKIKPHETADVRVTGYVEGKGKFDGMLGLLTTNYGNVGTGYSTEQRAKVWAAITGEPVTWSFKERPTKIPEVMAEMGDKVTWHVENVTKTTATVVVTAYPDTTYDWVGKIIEVSFMEATPAGKFRHPAFERVRFDKDEENVTALLEVMGGE